jgi:hypothetical protein
MRYVGEASGVICARQFSLFDFARNATTPGLTCESTSTDGKLALIP